MVYNYSRELVSGQYNIDNVYHVDAFGQPIKLDFEIKIWGLSKIINIVLYS